MPASQKEKAAGAASERCQREDERLSDTSLVPLTLSLWALLRALRYVYSSSNCRFATGGEVPAAPGSLFQLYLFYLNNRGIWFITAIKRVCVCMWGES